VKIELKVKTDKHKVQFQAVLRQQGSLWQKASLKQVSFRSRMKVKIRQIAIVKWLQCCKVDILEKGDGCNAGVSLGCSLEVCIGRHFRAWSSPAWVRFRPGPVRWCDVSGTGRLFIRGLGKLHISEATMPYKDIAECTCTAKCSVI